mmetsp:Transcript_12683/g.29454  ORF Transcript_12683/g.29454 Transcript_12683/m.29454 type:complete len:175 (-) Transcript_12683:57-581(-)
MKVGGKYQRFATGILVDNTGLEMGNKLLAMNEEIKKQALAKKSPDLGVHDRFKLQEYLNTSLPSVDAAIVHFPYTNGFVSALFHSYKVIPGLRKYAEEKGEQGNVPVVVTTCNVVEQMCTHYAPLVQGKNFLLGKLEADEYFASLPVRQWVNWDGVYKDFVSLLRPLRFLWGAS